MLLPASASAIRGPTPFTYCTGVESSTMGEDCAPRRYWRDGIERISGARQPPCTHLRSGSRPPTTAEGELVSKSSVLMNFLQALASILLGNLVYFSLYSSRPPSAPPTRPGNGHRLLVLPGGLRPHPHCKKMALSPGHTLLWEPRW